MPFVPPVIDPGGDPVPPRTSGGSGGGGGGTPASNPNIDLSNVTTTGGLLGLAGAVLVFGRTPFSSVGQCWELDTQDFDCEDDCQYNFKIEEVEVYRQPTVNKVIFRYRDLGKATFSFFIQGNVLGQSVISKVVTVVIGGNSDKKIYTASGDVTFTCEAPQLIIMRSGNSGPLKLTKVLLEIQHGDIAPI